MGEQDSTISGSWLKTAVVIGGLVIHAITVSFYVGVTVTGLNAKIDAGNESTKTGIAAVAALQTSQAVAIADLKSDTRSSNEKLHSELKESSSELKGDIKELSAIGIEVGKNSIRIDEMGHRLQILEERTSVIRSKPARNE